MKSKILANGNIELKGREYRSEPETGEACQGCDLTYASFDCKQMPPCIGLIFKQVKKRKNN